MFLVNIFLNYFFFLLRFRFRSGSWPGFLIIFRYFLLLFWRFCFLIIFFLDLFRRSSFSVNRWWFFWRGWFFWCFRRKWRWTRWFLRNAWRTWGGRRWWWWGWVFSLFFFNFFQGILFSWFFLVEIHFNKNN